MTKRVFKYKFQDDIVLPKGAEIVAFGEQGEDVFIWAIVDPENPPETRKFFIVGTGHQLPPEPYAYIGTLFIGPLVLHAFEFKD